MTCQQCGLGYCFVHANAHPPHESCRAYERRTKAAAKENQRFIKQVSKKCPHCKVPTQKGDGCNHMTCSQCRGHWCWICGTKVKSGGSEHFSPFNPFGCGFGMMVGNNFIHQSYARTFLHFMALFAGKVALVPFYLSGIAMALPWFFVMCVLCLPSICIGNRRGAFYIQVYQCLTEHDSYDGLPFSVIVFMLAFWPTAFFGIARRAETD